MNVHKNCLLGDGTDAGGADPRYVMDLSNAGFEVGIFDRDSLRLDAVRSNPPNVGCFIWWSGAR